MFCIYVVRVKNISMMINEAYFCLVFEGEKTNKQTITKNKKRKEKKTDPANESHCGAPGREGGIGGSGGRAAGSMRTWDEVWDGFWSRETETPGYGVCSTCSPAFCPNGVGPSGPPSSTSFMWILVKLGSWLWTP